MLKSTKKYNIRICLTILFFVFLFIAGLAPRNAAAEKQDLTVYAAASTTNAMTDIAKMFEKTHAVKIRLSFASSSTLAKQIEKGAPADVYLSANPKWMNYLDERGVTQKGTRVDLLGNRIVFIAPESSAIDKVAVDSGLDLPALLGDGRLSMGDPDHVPAGMYGKKAMENLGLWEGVQNRIARSKDVRAALVLVERGEAPLGQVYATDAAISKKVKVVGVFPESSHPPIVYPAALVQDSAPAREFLKYLGSPEAAEVFAEYGFAVR
ncbi:molybdate transport system substrate-binding protein [Desulfatibacillum alkenivorans DSM 16219]|uniref:Molybdate transport system substrate-binding protein n=1 Tax=Desulfatibacillum alkenivorans DSM 16219 TaxID=1121393 RepID=A0A1M6JLN1_9BACT|nr:molybdate ABC transporter substrate-binding protein [Desulfatibacillum alkenivorans]SHJ47625.1 molybdate transport system substrate-binding protein [Desulfatibacillum alkenivorans DSM 16219]